MVTKTEALNQRSALASLYYNDAAGEHEKTEKTCTFYSRMQIATLWIQIALVLIQICMVRGVAEHNQTVEMMAPGFLVRRGDDGKGKKPSIQPQQHDEDDEDGSPPINIGATDEDEVSGDEGDASGDIPENKNDVMDKDSSDDSSDVFNMEAMQEMLGRIVEAPSSTGGQGSTGGSKGTGGNKVGGKGKSKSDDEASHSSSSSDLIAVDDNPPDLLENLHESNLPTFLQVFNNPEAYIKSESTPYEVVPTPRCKFWGMAGPRVLILGKMKASHLPSSHHYTYIPIIVPSIDMIQHWESFLKKVQRICIPHNFDDPRRLPAVLPKVIILTISDSMLPSLLHANLDELKWPATLQIIRNNPKNTIKEMIAIATRHVSDLSLTSTGKDVQSLSDLNEIECLGFQVDPQVIFFNQGSFTFTPDIYTRLRLQNIQVARRQHSFGIQDGVNEYQPSTSVPFRSLSLSFDEDLWIEPAPSSLPSNMKANVKSQDETAILDSLHSNIIPLRIHLADWRSRVTIEFGYKSESERHNKDKQFMIGHWFDWPLPNLDSLILRGPFVFDEHRELSQDEIDQLTKSAKEVVLKIWGNSPDEMRSVFVASPSEALDMRRNSMSDNPDLRLLQNRDRRRMPKRSKKGKRADYSLSDFFDEGKWSEEIGLDAFKLFDIKPISVFSKSVSEIVVLNPKIEQVSSAISQLNELSRLPVLVDNLDTLAALHVLQYFPSNLVFSEGMKMAGSRRYTSVKRYPVELLVIPDNSLSVWTTHSFQVDPKRLQIVSRLWKNEAIPAKTLDGFKIEELEIAPKYEKMLISFIEVESLINQNWKAIKLNNLYLGPFSMSKRLGNKVQLSSTEVTLRNTFYSLGETMSHLDLHLSSSVEKLTIHFGEIDAPNLFYKLKENGNPVFPLQHDHLQQSIVPIHINEAHSLKHLEIVFETSSLLTKGSVHTHHKFVIGNVLDAEMPRLEKLILKGPFVYDDSTDISDDVMKKWTSKAPFVELELWGEDSESLRVYPYSKP